MKTTQRKKAIRIYCIILLLLIVLIALVYRGNVITFKDENLTKAILQLAQKEDGQKIYERDIKNILKKNNNMIDLSGKKISELDGLEKFSIFNIEKVDLSNNNISDTTIVNNLNTKNLNLENQLIEIDLGTVDRYSELKVELPQIYAQSKSKGYRIFTTNNVEIIGSGGKIIDDKIILATEGTGAQSTILEIVGGIANTSKIKIIYFIIDKSAVLENKQPNTIVDIIEPQESGSSLQVVGTKPALIAQAELIGGITINNGEKYTNSVNVTLNLNITGGKAPYKMRLSNNNVEFTDYEDFVTTKNYRLPEMNGSRTVYVQYKDADGIVSNIFSKEIVLDTEKPVLENLEVITNNTTNNKITRTGNIIEVKMAFNESLAIPPIVTIGTTNIAMMVTGQDKTWVARYVIKGDEGFTQGNLSIVVNNYKDAAGNIGEEKIDNSVYFKKERPNATLNIATTNQSTNKVKLNDIITIIILPETILLDIPVVKMIIGGQERILAVMDNEDGTYTATYTVVERDPEETIQIITKITDEAGNSKEIKDTSLTIEKTPPIITGVTNHQITNQDLTISFDKGTAKLNGEPFTNGDSVLLEGIYTLVVTDEAGNSTAINFEIDKTAPTGGILINGGATKTSSTTCILLLSAIDNNGIEKISLSNDGINWSAEEDYVVLKAYTLPGADGTKTVYVKYKDTIGNWSVAYHANIELSTIQPVLTQVSIESNNTINNQYATRGDTIIISMVSDKSLAVIPIVRIKTSGLETARFMTVSGSGNNYTATYTIPADEMALEEGVFVISISEFEDEFGNVGETVMNTTDESTVTFIKDPPTVTIRGPEEIVTGEIVSYTLTFRGASEINITPDDIIINRRGDLTGGTVRIEGTDNERTVLITDVSGYGYISIKVAANVILNPLGDGNVETAFSDEALIDHGIGTLAIQITGNSDDWTNQDVLLTASVTELRGRIKI